MRPVYISSGGFVQIDNLSTLRARILPKHVGTMLVVYLVHVRPFLALISPQNPVINNNFIFPTAQGHWHTQSYMQMIPRESQRRINKTLGLEDINDVHIRYLRETNPSVLTPAMWERLKTDNGGGCALPAAAPEQLPSSEIIQQWRTLQTGTLSPSLQTSLSTMALGSRTPSPAISDASLSSSGVLLPCQYSLPLNTAVPELKSSFSSWSSSSTSPLATSPGWAPNSSAESNWDPMMDPNDFFLPTASQTYGPLTVSTSHQQFDYNNSAYSNANSPALTAPPSPTKILSQHVPQGGISLMGFIPWEAEKKTEKPNRKPAAKRKINAKNKDKVINSKSMKKGTGKTSKRGSRRTSLKTEDEDEIVSSCSTTGSVTRILDNLGLTNAVLNRDRDCPKRRGTLSRGKGATVEDPDERTNFMLANLGLTKFVTK